jgi:hypothetical protein
MWIFPAPLPVCSSRFRFSFLFCRPLDSVDLVSDLISTERARGIGVPRSVWLSRAEGFAPRINFWRLFCTAGFEVMFFLSDSHVHRVSFLVLWLGLAGCISWPSFPVTSRWLAVSGRRSSSWFPVARFSHAKTVVRIVFPLSVSTLPDPFFLHYRSARPD